MQCTVFSDGQGAVGDVLEPIVTQPDNVTTEVRNPANLVPYEKNARLHSDEQIDQIAASILEFGFTNPVLIDDMNNILAGHGRVQAAKRLELDRVPVIVLTGLTEAQKRAYILADNKLALNAEWDDALLETELVDLSNLEGFDLTVAGFSAEDLESLLGAQDAFQPTLSPTAQFSPVTQEQVAKANAGLQNKFATDPSAAEKLEIICPFCAKDFHISKPK